MLAVVVLECFSVSLLFVFALAHVASIRLFIETKHQYQGVTLA